MDKTTFSKIESSLYHAIKTLNAPGFIDLAATAQFKDAQEHYELGKKFLLDIKKTQSFYDTLDKKYQFENFMLPFDNTIFAFEKPLIIKWINKERTGYKEMKLLAINIYKFGSNSIKMEDGTYIQEYKAYLYFEEEPIEGREVIAHQYIRFVYLDTKRTTTKFTHVDHYPCTNKYLCSVDKNGGWKEGSSSDWFCQEILTRDSLVETLSFIVNKLNDIQVEVRKKRIKRTEDAVAPNIPIELLKTSGNMPKDGYIQYLDGIRYHYDSKEVDYGSGTKHRYRYDVRRHPRIVGGHIVWVNPHQRGSGSYKSKIYANTKTWWVNYVWYQAEKLSKHRIFEIILIKVLKLLERRQLYVR